MTADCGVFWASPSRNPRIESLLTDTERVRAARLRPDDRARFSTGRALTRLILGERLGVAPDVVPIAQRCATCGSPGHGKPLLAARGPAFNISHAGDRVGVAITDRDAVGLDVELLPDAPPPWRERRTDDLRSGEDTDTDPERARLAAIALASDEHAFYTALPRSERGAAVVRWWTRKEAVLKVTGVGLATSPDRVRVTKPSEPPAILDGPPGVLLHDLRPGVGYVATLAVLGGVVRIDERDATGVLTARVG